jgi:hypothetical protein
MESNTAMNVDEFIARLQLAVHRALKTNSWDEWKAVQDQHLTDHLMQQMTDVQRVRLHELTHGFIVLADPDGTWSDQLSDRLEREYRESLARAR